MRVKRGLNDTS